ncbi:MAG: Ig-like domain-containing protein [Deltaproteobacteria bacterium]|nr:Ig-like domain-containing protein [Deltaproteobacteria bacterium]
MWRMSVAVVTLVLGAGCGQPEVVVPEVLSIVSVLPAHGSIDIGPSVEALVYFSAPVKDAAAAAADVSLDCLGRAPCETAAVQGCPGASATVAVTTTLEVNQVVHLKPDAALAADTCYVIAIGAGIEAATSDVGPLPIEVRSSFQVRP